MERRNLQKIGERQNPSNNYSSVQFLREKAKKTMKERCIRMTENKKKTINNTGKTRVQPRSREYRI